MLPEPISGSDMNPLIENADTPHWSDTVTLEESLAHLRKMSNAESIDVSMYHLIAAQSGDHTADRISKLLGPEYFSTLQSATKLPATPLSPSTSCT